MCSQRYLVMHHTFIKLKVTNLGTPNTALGDWNVLSFLTLL